MFLVCLMRLASFLWIFIVRYLLAFQLWDVKYLLEEDEGIEEERQEANADVSGRDADASVPNGTPAQAPMAVDSDEEMDSDEDQGEKSSSYFLVAVR